METLVSPDVTEEEHHPLTSHSEPPACLSLFETHPKYLVYWMWNLFVSRTWEKRLQVSIDGIGLDNEEVDKPEGKAREEYITRSPLVGYDVIANEEDLRFRSTPTETSNRTKTRTEEWKPVLEDKQI